MIQHDTVVIGAGLAGLSFAYHYDKNLPVYESNDIVGGLVRTIDYKGCKFDLAPHLLHLRNPYVRELVFDKLGLEVETHKRKAHIYYDKVIIPYPFELNLLNLSEKTKRECLEGLNEVKHLTREEELETRKGSLPRLCTEMFRKRYCKPLFVAIQQKNMGHRSGRYDLRIYVASDNC